MRPAIPPQAIEMYQDDRGRVPFADWLESLKNRTARIAIMARIRRVSIGLFGDCKSVGSGVFELRVKVGPGYRVYFATVDDKIVLLLAGGDKSTQAGDIERAKDRLKDWRQR